MSPFHLITLIAVRMLENNKRRFVSHKICIYRMCWVIQRGKVNSCSDECTCCDLRVLVLVSKGHPGMLQILFLGGGGYPTFQKNEAVPRWWSDLNVGLLLSSCVVEKNAESFECTSQSTLIFRHKHFLCCAHHRRNNNKEDKCSFHP